MLLPCLSRTPDLREGEGRWYSAGMKRLRCGQAMLEYMIAVVVVLTLAGMLTFVLSAIRRSGDRTTSLVASEYP